MNLKYLAVLVAGSVLAGCASTTATALNKADGSIEIISKSSAEDYALEAALDKGIQQCKASGKNFVVIDRRSTYQGVDPNVRAAINVASILTKGGFYGAGTSSSDWQVVVTGKCQ